MDIQIAVSKINKHASPDSGDTLEVVERPNGGLSVVLADGLTTGQEAKLVSSLVVHKVINLLAEGVRDSAAARAASDFLFTERNGQATATLNILSVDLQTNTLVISRNSAAPVFIVARNRIDCLSSESLLIGNARNIRPTISELPLEVGLTIIMYTDGLLNAGMRYGKSLDVCMTLEALMIDLESSQEDYPSPQFIADALLTHACRLDEGRPEDDISIVVLRSIDRDHDGIRRMMINLPVVTI
jgi:serine phosphatase RsbU (regulator of sigma subunit)